ncbi:hypothetical protein [Tsukamurella sp. PLM1]|uniref:hypothetical protein n=1 Tax=Tsukamurella sp. PLM1 TaxID=2929795 RepID=UPI0020C09A92|nr:hypothetical protein [Tsukamurella sp. PLM1]
MPIRDRALHAAAVRVALTLLDGEWTAVDSTGGAGADRTGGERVAARCWTGSP